MQFRDAELVDVDTYKLSGFLRRQQGSEDAMAAGSPVGSRIALLTGAEQRLNAAEWERGLQLDWRVGSESGAISTSWIREWSYGRVGSRMWSPAHFRAHWSGDDLAVGWIRRARKEGGPWMAGEPILEVAEGYWLRVSGGIFEREWDVLETLALYSQGDMAADFPAGGVALIEVAQLGQDGQPGGLGHGRSDNSGTVTDCIVVFRLNIPMLRLVLGGAEASR